MCRIVSDLCVGEFQQMANTKKDKKDRFQMYIDKSYNKTASVLANSCRAVTLLATSNLAQSQNLTDIEDSSFHYGKNIGIAFQLMDDWLDFAATAEQLGKPAAADLK
jgi:decaprenyl-diphosphate synthase subunit 1